MSIKNRFINKKIIIANLSLFLVGLALLGVYLVNEQPYNVDLKGNAFLNYLESSKLSHKKFILPDDKTFVPNIELYDPFYQTSAFNQTPLDLLQAVYKYEKTCSAVDYTRAAGLASQYVMNPSKLLEWHKAICNNKINSFQLWIERTPYIHPSGVSFAKLYFDRLADESKLVDESFFHVTEKSNPTEFDKWYLSLKSEYQKKFSSGFKATHFGEHFGMLREEQGVGYYVLIYNRELISSDTKSKFNIEIKPRDQSLKCDYLQYGLCFFKSEDSLLFLKSIWLLPIFIFLMLYVLMALLLPYTLWRIEKQNYNANQALLFQVISHEIRTPLTSLKLSSDGLRQQFDQLDSSSQRHVMSMLDSIYDLEKIVSKTLRELKGENLSSSHNIVHVTEDIIQHKYQGLVEVEIPEQELMVSLPLFWFEISLVNLLRNALLHGKPPVKCRVYVESGLACVEVSDSGQAEINVLTSFRNYFKKVKSSKGLGIGLKIVSRKIQEYGGELEVRSHPTRFILKFKLLSKQSELN